MYLLISCIVKKKSGIIEEMNSSVGSFRNVPLFIVIGAIMAGIASTRPRFVTFDPNKLPMDIPTLPELIAEKETDNSGRLVATESKINPITSSPSFVMRAIRSEFLITIWLDFDRMAIDIANMKSWYKRPFAADDVASAVKLAKTFATIY